MEVPISLYQSNFCRLCSENNVNGIDIFAITEESIELSSIVNKYLPIKVEDDKKYPKSICPGCHIQLESMKLFMDLIVEGQLKLRNMYQNQQERHSKEARKKQQLQIALHKVNPNSSVESFTIQSDEIGDKFLIQILSDGPLFPPDHELALRAEGLERPKRKRGRPPKPQVIDLNSTNAEESPPQDNIPEENDFEEDGHRKRKIKAPAKYEGIVQGDELENILKKEGILDDDTVKNDIFTVEKGDETVVGRTENGDGQDLGQPVVVHPKIRSNKFGHPKKKSKKKFQCDICDRKFLNHGNYVLHRKCHNLLYVCDECSFETDDKNVIDQHQVETRHHGITSMETQELASNKLSETTKVIENPSMGSNPQNFVCGQCNKSFTTKQNLEVHNRAVHNLEKPFVCPKCDRTFAYARLLKWHLLKHEKDDASNNTKEFPCETCGKVLQHPSSLAYHKESEHGDGIRFVCTRCDKVFKHRQLLVRHQLVHTEKRPYVCKKCNASFKSQANLSNHQNIHSGVRKFVCKECGQRYAHRTSLTLHQRWHDGAKPYKCEFCDKSFSQKGNLSEHRRIHTGEKPYCCDECGRSFTTSSQFQMHKKRHAGVKPWTCDFCHKRFLHADSFKAHVNRHLEHRPHRCTSCDRSFTDAWSLKRHQRAHTGEQPYACAGCDRRFADSSNRCKHARQHGHAVGAVGRSGPDGQAAGISGEGRGDEEALEVRQLTDHQGNPISITTQDGKTVPVVTIGDDEESIQGLMPDGTLIPIEITTEPVKGDSEERLVQESPSESPIMMDSSAGIVQVAGVGLDPNLYVTDDSGQGICLVYTMEENNEVDQQLAINPLLIQGQ